jgi:hypothetical protein
MATNRDLLKEAIAEAKAVKEMAIANAKSALEESFTPRIKEMLSAKLQEMEEEEIDESYLDMDPEGPTAHGNIEEEEEPMEEELNLDELLAELDEEEEPLNEVEEDEAGEESEESEEPEEEGEPLDLEDMTDEDLKKMIEDVISDMVATGELEAGEAEEDTEEIEDTEEEMSDEESVDIEELLKEIEEEEIEEGYEDNGLEELENEAIHQLSSELEEAHSTIQSLRSDLNEVNLLNAKLLYTNKIFKSKNLNESQKVKVLTSFDQATTVRETKLVYQTLSEGLKVKTGKTIKESLGSASKSILTENAKSPIIENDNFNRMKELAFYSPKH